MDAKSSPSALPANLELFYMQSSHKWEVNLNYGEEKKNKMALRKTVYITVKVSLSSTSSSQGKGINELEIRN